MSRGKPLPKPPESAHTLPEPPKDKRRAATARMAARMGSWRPARVELTRVRAVPTIFPWFDFATKVGGLPVGRLTLIHGPSSEGKTALALGFGLSFLKRGHFFGYIDAEMTTPITWLEGLMAEEADNPLFFGKRPKHFEDVVDSVREMLKVIIVAKETGECPDAGAIIVVDSIRKLVPERFLEKIKKYGAQGKDGSVDGMKGMGGTVKAKDQADWLDELTPLLYRADCALVAIARESHNRNAGRGEPEWQRTGGSSWFFEASIAMRVERDWTREGSGPEAVVIGEKHDVSLYKSKVARKEDKAEYFAFHTSNGKITPEGFEPARDLLELGIQLDVMKSAGSYFRFEGVTKQGKSAMVKRLTDDVGLRNNLERAVRAKFKNVETESLGAIASPTKKQDKPKEKRP